MAIKTIEQQEIREYLLGRLPGKQQMLLEERFLMQDELYEELAIAEDELVDEFIRNELSPGDRQSFESHFIAAPEHQEKLLFARTFGKYLAGEDTARQAVANAAVSRRSATFSLPRWLGFLPIRNPILGYAMAAAVVVLVVGISWVAWNNFTLATRHPANVVSVVLAPGLSRGDPEQDKRITISPEAGTVRLQLLLPENRSTSYQATILDIEGRELMTEAKVRTEIVDGQRAGILDVRAEVLPTGEYRVKLSGVDEQGKRGNLATYSFRVQAS